jgi:hypothetical protein
MELISMKTNIHALNAKKHVKPAMGEPLRIVPHVIVVEVRGTLLDQLASVNQDTKM